jgi:O-acetyl-ADP-ribose deacetylase (regulator of RNase III)
MTEKIQVIKGAIVDLQVDAIVTGANKKLNGGNIE